MRKKTAVWAIIVVGSSLGGLATGAWWLVCVSWWFESPGPMLLIAGAGNVALAAAGFWMGRAVTRRMLPH